MARNRVRSKGRSGRESFAAVPRAVMEHPDYQTLKPASAYRLLLEFAYQYNGRNNGDLTAAYSVLKSRGWSSQQTIGAAIDGLLAAGLIVRSREGRFCNPGGKPHLYALTWRPVDDCPGKDLDMPPTAAPLRNFSLEISKIPTPQNGDGSLHKVVRQRSRDSQGRFSSIHKVVRLVDGTVTTKW